MTRNQARHLYIHAGGPDDHSEAEWEEIHREMQAIIDAPSDRAAGRIVSWWGCWSKTNTATAFARRVRLQDIARKALGHERRGE